MSYFPTLKCTLEEFKHAVAEFIKAAESGTLTEDQLENGIKAATLMYLGVTPADDDTLLIAKGYFDHANKVYWHAECVKQHPAPQTGNQSGA